ncbi:MAG: LptF/LptG family permease [Planctomycetaceae bacterium]
MLTTFDKYLLGRMLHTFAVFFVATYGLYIVIDLFTNIDEFQLGVSAAAAESAKLGHAMSARDELLDLLIRIAEYYAFRAAEFFELAGPILIVVSVVAVLGLLEKHRESHPVLAAGIPAFRLLRPFLFGAALLNAALVANQEVVLPNIAVQLQTPRSDHARVQRVEPVYDYSNYLMHIDGEQVIVEERRLKEASFNLPRELAVEVCALRAESAVYIDENGEHPPGWLLHNLTGVFDEELLTEEGRRRVKPHPNGTDVFVVSDVSFDQLYNRGRNLKLLSSAQLIERIRNPSTGPVPVRGQSLALHSRVTRPILSMLSITIALPLVMRRESRSLIANMAICAAVLGFFYVFTQGSIILGSSGLISRPDLAAWIPVIVTGSTGVWTAGYVQT